MLVGCVGSEKVDESEVEFGGASFNLIGPSTDDLKRHQLAMARRGSGKTVVFVWSYRVVERPEDEAQKGHKSRERYHEPER